MANTINEVVARPARTAAQAAPAWVITEFIDAFIWNMDDRQYGAAVALLTMILSYGLAAYENYSGKGFLRRVPPKEVPVVDNKENGVFNASTVWVVLGIVGLVLIVLLLVGAIHA